jgi:hypothetical protein
MSETATKIFMRFYLGEIYECETADKPHRVLVVGLANGGRKATLRSFDGDAEFTAVWAQFCQTGKWRRLEVKEAAD